LSLRLRLTRVEQNLFSHSKSDLLVVIDSTSVSNGNQKLNKLPVFSARFRFHPGTSKFNRLRFFYVNLLSHPAYVPDPSFATSNPTQRRTDGIGNINPKLTIANDRSRVLKSPHRGYLMYSKRLNLRADQSSSIATCRTESKPLARTDFQPVSRLNSHV
jgi:hypothetical protein